MYIYHNSQELWQMENELAMQQAMADIQKQHLEEVISFRDANMIMNHSIVEHLRMIERCLSRGQTETAAQYLQDSLQLYQSGRNDVFYSSNPILDAVIRYKAAFNPDYTFTCRSMVSDSLNINQIDLGILLMNMIDERIRGIERHGFRKEINIMSWQKGSLVFLKADSEWEKGESLEPEHTILQHVAERNHGYIEKGVYSPTDLCAYISG